MKSLNERIVSYENLMKRNNVLPPYKLQVSQSMADGWGISDKDTISQTVLEVHSDSKIAEMERWTHD